MSTNMPVEVRSAFFALVAGKTRIGNSDAARALEDKLTPALKPLVDLVLVARLLRANGFKKAGMEGHGYNRQAIWARNITRLTECRKCGADVDTTIRSQCDECGSLVE